MSRPAFEKILHGGGAEHAEDKERHDHGDKPKIHS